jgi:hypothetical protein
VLKGQAIYNASINAFRIDFAFYAFYDSLYAAKAGLKLTIILPLSVS